MLKKKSFKSIMLIFCMFTLTFLMYACTKKIEISIDKDAHFSMNLGESVEICVTFNQETPSDFELNWSSSDPDVLSVNPIEDGLKCVVTALSKGSATISVVYKDTEISASATVEVIDIEGDLAAAKAEKVLEIDALLGTYNESDYSDTSWAVLNSYIAAAKTTVNAYATIEEVDLYDVDILRTQCDAVQTLEEDLDTAKAEKTSEINQLLATYDQNDYNTENWAIILSHINNLISDVDECDSILEVEQIKVEDLKNLCDTVETLEQELSRAKSEKIQLLNDLLALYNLENYNADKWTSLNEIIDLAISEVNEAQTFEQVELIVVADVKSACDEVGVKASYKVFHLQENLNEGWTESDAETIDTDSGEQTQAEAKSYVGFEFQTIVQEIVKSDNTTEIYIYYNRIKYAVTLEATDGYATFDKTSVLARYGSEITFNGQEITIDKTVVNLSVNSDTDEYVYTFIDWTIESSTVTKDTTIIANITREETEAKVGTTYFANLDEAIETAKVNDTLVILKDASIEDDITFVSNVEIANGVVVTVIETASLIFEGEFENRGSLISFVSSREQFLLAVEYSSKIILANDIAATTKFDTRIQAFTKDYNLTIDLNGFNYTDRITITNYISKGSYHNHCANITIEDSFGGGAVGALDDINIMWGIVVLGNANVVVNLNEIKVFAYTDAFSSNGNCEGAVVNATNCYFKGGISEINSLGAYLPGNYSYNFTDCDFIGYSAIHIKSGDLILDNCRLIATGSYIQPSYNGGDPNMTGNGLMVEPTIGYFEALSVLVDGGFITSVNGYAIEEAAFAKEGTTPNAYATVEVKNCSLTGLIGSIKSENNVFTTHVTTRDQFLEAIEYSTKIILARNIISKTTDETRIKVFERDYDLIIDLNGFSYSDSITITNFISKNNYYAHKANITIISSVDGGKIGDIDESHYYGIAVLGNIDIVVNLENIKSYGYYGGLASNGLCEGSTITATGCHFEGTYESDCLGAYLPGNYTYNFEDCEFKGATGIHIKSGTLTLENCVLTAFGEYSSPSYYGNGANVTGNGLMVEPTVGYFETLIVTINGGTITSEKGYAIEEYASAKEGDEPKAYATVEVNDCDLSGSLGECLSQNDKITIND